MQPDARRRAPRGRLQIVKALGTPLVALADLAMIASVFALTSDLARRFLFDPDGSTVWLVTVQGALAVVAGLAITTRGWDAMARRFIGFPVAQRYPWVTRVTVWAVVLGVVAAVDANLSSVAEWYDRFGMRLGECGHAAFAMRMYRHATVIAPDYEPAHSRLGSAYEAIGESERALAEYRLAIMAKPRSLYAYNNAANLLLESHDFVGALTLLTKESTYYSSKRDSLDSNTRGRVEYDLYKNLGAAHLGLHEPVQAGVYFTLAQHAMGNGAEVNCWMAERLEQMGDREHKAASYWRACLSFAKRDHVGIRLLSVAQERSQAVDGGGS
jgi:tetratricopeptide (TPR) repeat protein